MLAFQNTFKKTMRNTRCRDSQQNKIFPLLGSPSAKQRNLSIKDNINKLILIGTKEVKEFSELMKEFDIAHKKALNIAEKKESLNDENIFLNKENNP